MSRFFSLPIVEYKLSGCVSSMQPGEFRSVFSFLENKRTVITTEKVEIYKKLITFEFSMYAYAFNDSVRIISVF